MLYSKRLMLREPHSEDAEFFLNLLNDPDWLRFIGDRNIRTLEDARAYIETLRQRRSTLSTGLDVVLRREDTTSIGICGLIWRDWLDGPDLGFAFLPQYRGAGYAAEAARLTLDYAGTHLGAKSVYGIVTPENCDSIRLLEKLGFGFVRRATPPLEANELCVFMLGTDNSSS
jgi:ribosomal-protein-alanine N-acetyltransferase